MKINLKTNILLFTLFISFVSAAQTSLLTQAQSPLYLQYIEQYYNLAQKQQQEFGIPASITLAQGLLESSAGIGELAVKSNNHFGIKCTDWSGERVYHDDDEKGECFRKYDEVWQSYHDHSLFLKNRTRYSFLFDLKQTDYKGWAYGLKKAGYATDPAYPTKLITLIENYDLHRFDQLDYNAKKDKEEKIQGSFGSMGSIKSAVNHGVFKVNGVPFVTSLLGDTYASLSEEFEMSESRLRYFNEVNLTEVLNAGIRVFIAEKKNRAPKGYETHRIENGESMYSISQDYGVKVSKLYELNMMAYTDGAKVGQTLKLR